MHSRARITVERIMPVRPRLVLLGLALGLIMGGLRLHESSDAAASYGFAIFLSVTVGIWLGEILAILLLDIALHSLNALMRRVDVLMRRLRIEDPDDSGPHTRSGLRVVVRFSIYATPLSCLLIVQSLLFAILEAKFDFNSLSFHIWALLVESTLLMASLVVQWAYMWHLWRKLISIEQRVDRVEPPSLFAGKLDGEYNRVRSIMHKVIGGRVNRLPVNGW